MNITVESELKSKLKSSNPEGICKRLMSYLGPMDRIDVISSSKNFLKDCLNILETRLFQDRYLDPELLQVYGLCLRPYMKVANSTEVRTHIHLILETIAEELRRNKERIRESELLLSIINLYAQENLEDQSTESISYAFESYLSHMIKALHIVFCAVHKLIKEWICKLETMQGEAKDVQMDMLSTLLHLLHVFAELILIKLRMIPEKIENEQTWMVASAIMALGISIKINFKYQESKKVIRNIIVSEWCETKQAGDIINSMIPMVESWPKNDKSEQAIEILSMCSDTRWLFLEFHASDLLKDELQSISSKLDKESSSLLRLLNDIDHSEMKKKLVAILEVWSRTKDQIHNLPTPVHIVKTWVEFQFILDDCSDSPILFDILTPSIQKSKRNTWILLDQEYKAYMERSSQFSSTSKKMKSKITSAFMKLINTTPESHHQKAQTPFEKEKIIKDCKTYDGTIQCLEATIKMMDTLSKSKHSSSANLINLLLFVAYFLRDLSETKANIESAKNLPERVLILIYNIFDVLQLKGLEDELNVAYDLMIKMYDLMSLKLDAKLNLLWKSGRLGHPLCASPLNMKFIRNLSNESMTGSNEVEKFETYINHFGIEFQQHFSFLFSNYHLSSNPKIKVTSKDPICCSHPTFHAGYIYQTLIAKGKLVEALSYAKEAQERQYSELSKFTHGQERDKRCGTRFSINTWEIIKSIVEVVISFDSQPIDLHKRYTSPWKILQGYLESTLQVGTLYEMMGDGAEAVAHLELGKEISSSLDLDLFVVAFSSLLGKIYTQQKKIDMAETELTTARKLFLKRENKFGCSKCKLLFNASVIEHIGHLRKIKPTACRWFSKNVTNFYERALEELENLTWKNSLSCPDTDASPQFVECSCKDKQKRRNKKARVERKEVLDQMHCTSFDTCSTACSCSQLGCWQCLPTKVEESGLLEELIDLKWEFVRRKISMKLLSESGKYSTNSNDTEKVCASLLRRISILIGKIPFCNTFSSILPDHFRKLVARETTNDVFAIERAGLLNDICWYLLKGYNTNSTRNIFINQKSIKVEEIASWLILAFVLSRDVPIMLQEVSKLLAVLYLVSSMSKKYSFPPYSKKLNKLAWIFYFHQASIGTHLSGQFISNLFEKDKGTKSKGSTFALLRPPKKTENLQKHVTKFISKLPSTTVVCISSLGREYGSLLEKLLSHQKSVQAWMLVTRKSGRHRPIVMLFPIDTILQDHCMKYPETSKRPSKKWDDTILNQIAPTFKIIMDQYKFMIEDTLSSQEKRLLLGERANDFETHLDTLLSRSEELWFGSWKYMFLGELSDCKIFKKVFKDLLVKLRGDHKLHINKHHLRLLLGGTKHICEKGTSISPLTSNQGCYIAKIGYCTELPKSILLKKVNVSEEQTLAIKKAQNLLKFKISTKRDPIILVLDYEVQMFPWEGLPVQRNQEVYRMPSISSIYAVYDKCNHMRRNSLNYPEIDPNHAYYLVNPDGSLKNYENKFGPYFEEKHLKGVTGAGTAPSTVDLLNALESREIFLYFGHGCGEKFIPKDMVKNLSKCPTSLLMGCSSCSSNLQGCYAPAGAHYSYQMGGSPVVVGNLWTMIDSELIRFAEKFFEDTLDKPATSSQQTRIGTQVSIAREKVLRPLMSGASIVNYGLPVVLSRRKETEGQKY